MHAFLWHNGHMRDLGTLGGPDSIAWQVNNRGQVAGTSYISAVPNPATGQPPLHPFLWENGHMRDLGTLGGTVSFDGTSGINSQGEVIGTSGLVGDQKAHPYLWDGHRLRDLGTFGGDNGEAFHLNDAGQVVGRADVPGSAAHHAFAWARGVMTDLGVLPGATCSTAYSNNALGQVVGASAICGNPARAFLWDHGSIVDLNTLVAPSDLTLDFAGTINDRGEIVGNAVLPNGDTHMFLLIPRHLAEREGITQNAPAHGTSGPAARASAPSTPCATLPGWRATPLYRKYQQICRS